MTVPIGFSGFPGYGDQTYSNSAIDDVIQQMNTDHLDIWRMSFIIADSTHTGTSTSQVISLVNYFLTRCDHKIIVEPNHYYNQHLMTSSEWTADINRCITILAGISTTYADRVYMEVQNEQLDPNIVSNTQTFVTAVRNAGYTNPLVSNVFWRPLPSPQYAIAQMANINDPLGKFYSGHHVYIDQMPLASAKSVMQAGLDAGVKMINTEIGAHASERNYFTTTNVAQICDFMQWCAERGIGNNLWMRVALENYPTYTQLGLYFPVTSVTRTLIINAAVGGSVSPVPGVYTKNDGDLVTLTATPSAGYEFTKWIINGVDITANSYTFALTADTAVTPIFTEVTVPPSSIIGNNVVEATPNDWGASTIVTNRFQATKSGFLDDLILYINSASGSPTVRAVVFSDDFQLRGVGTDLSNPVTPNWNILSGIREQNIPVVQGQFYRLGFYMSSVGLIFDAENQNSTTDILAYINAQPSVPASFTPEGYRNYMMSIYANILEGTPPITRTLNMASAVGGTTSPIAGIYAKADGERITLTAYPNSGYVFDKWNINGVDIFSDPNPAPNGVWCQGGTDVTLEKCQEYIDKGFSYIYMQTGYWKADGSIQYYVTAQQIQTAVANAHAKKLKIYAWITSQLNSSGIEDPANLIDLSTITKRQSQINLLVALAQNYGYDGIADDIENMAPWSYENLIAFFNDATTQLNSVGKEYFTALISYWGPNMGSTLFNSIHVDRLQPMLYGNYPSGQTETKVKEHMDFFLRYSSSPVGLAIHSDYPDYYALSDAMRWVDEQLASGTPTTKLAGIDLFPTGATPSTVTASEWNEWNNWSTAHPTGTESTNPYTFSITADTTITPTFTPTSGQQYTVTVNSTPIQGIPLTVSEVN